MQYIQTLIHLHIDSSDNLSHKVPQFSMAHVQESQKGTVKKIT